MPKFKFKAAVTVSCWTEVEAETLEEAMTEAKQRSLASLPYQPFSSPVNESWHFDNDGEPQEIESEDD
ncbi:hypothetical protein GZ77_09480 [Endozoicomonas montiporae]|uniref:Uncharacterized protein n=2 Tax=Endozoicomonas montiporae TaxID=1027273 RepID=A0A081N7Y0_9GAMM|nr:hypothetical protein [Endozoicomonas montiporae]AMO55578.1 hypothetical protein EZMO1_1390 [Endozoicomonas montiporae CL-33]KEQ14553.1 hypothetical protein GZ77_09480 [Endozoicomonas montiporae]